MDRFISSRLSSDAVNKFFDRTRELNCEIHTLQIHKDGELLVRIAQDPYSCSDTPEVYSLSKMFTSTVAGIASDMGLISTEDPVLKYFPEIETDNRYFKMMKIRHVLSMNTGHDHCVMPLMSQSDDAARGFFSVEPKFEPGTHFEYNTGATCLMGIIISRASGRDFFEFACEHLFFPMGIRNVHWCRCKDGSCLCGTGLHISSDDISKVLLMYLSNGIYNGRRILSENWIKEASAPISDTVGNGTEDWAAGYGYQLWMNYRDGFRGDGAFGQLGMILPKRNAVIAVQALAGDMQTEIDACMDLLDSADSGDGKRTDDEYAYAPFEKALDDFTADAVFDLEPNGKDFTAAWVHVGDGIAAVTFRDTDGKTLTLNAGSGKWLRSSFFAREMTSIITSIMPDDIPEQIETAACYKLEDGKIVICVRFLSCPHTEYYNITMTDDSLEIFISQGMREDRTRQIRGRKVR